MFDTFENLAPRLVCATHDFWGPTYYASGDVPECMACIDEYDRRATPCCSAINTTCCGHDDQYDEEPELSADELLAYQLMRPVLFNHDYWAVGLVLTSPNFCEFKTWDDVPF